MMKSGVLAAKTILRGTSRSFSNRVTSRVGTEFIKSSQANVCSSSDGVCIVSRSKSLGLSSQIRSVSVLCPKIINVLLNHKRLMSVQAGDIDGVFTSIKSKLNTDMVNSTQAVYQFNIMDGDKEVTYHIDLKNGEGSAGKGKPADTPDATISINTDNFQKMFLGKIKPTSAFMTGKLKIAGNMQKAMKLEKMMTSLREKA